MLTGLFIVRDKKKIFLGLYTSGIRSENTIQDKQVYVDLNGRFSIEIPSDFTSNTFEQLDTASNLQYEVTVFVGEKKEENFQLAISEYNDSDSISIAAIKRDNPDILMDDSHDIEIAGSRGVTFLDMESKNNPQRNVWFINNGHLYQITTYRSFDTKMSDILSSWKWGSVTE